jgi:hypothetical protein
MIFAPLSASKMRLSNMTYGVATMLRLVAFEVCAETVAVLLHLLAEARKGRIRGLCVCWWKPGGGSQVSLTGLYHAEPERALSAADMIKITACHQLDLF